MGGGFDGLGVDPDFSFRDSDVLHLEIEKKHPLVGESLNRRLLKCGRRDCYGWGFLDDQIMDACMIQMQTIRASTYVVPLGVTHCIIKSGKGSIKFKRDSFKESDQVLFVTNIGGDLKKPAIQRKGNHWVVLECKREVPGRVLGFDSLSSDEHETEMKQIAENVKKYVWASDPELVYHPHPIHCRSDSKADRVQQPDGEWDCGVYALSFVKSAIDFQMGRDWEAHAAEMEQELADPLTTRRKIAAYIRDFCV